VTDATSVGSATPSPWSRRLGHVGATALRDRIPRFLITTVQLALALILLRALEIEPASGLPRILLLIFAGFVVHAALPLRWRLPFFLALSFAGIVVVLGPVTGALVVLLGLVLIGICHIPIAYSTRVLLLITVVACLAAIHGGLIALPTAVSAAIGLPSLPRLVLPVLGSLFMFRLIIYLYDLRHEERARVAGTPSARDATRASVWARIAYFFLLPNVCFLLFPVVDYRTYRRTYYDTEAQVIYQKGVWLISLGLAYLLFYRLIYHYLVPPLDEIQGLWGVVRFMTSSYLVYIRVVGQFHLIVGLLCLFGFNLPPVHRYYLLASGFTDFWRRARIDWKDFMVKVFYFPVLVPLQRKLGAMTALVIATVGVFIATWLLHSYQWFWLRGDFRLSSADGAFWTIIGGCVLINSVIEARGARARAKSARSIRPALVHAAKVVGMFVFMCVLWSFWSSPSLAVWWSVVKAAGDSSSLDYLLLVGVACLAVGVGAMVLLRSWNSAVVPGARAGSAAVARQSTSTMPWWKPAGVLAAVLLVLLVRVPMIQGSIGEPAVRVASTLSTERLNVVDEERAERGYYEVLLDGPRSTAGFLAGAGSEPADVPDSADIQSDAEPLDAEPQVDLPTVATAAPVPIADEVDSDSAEQRPIRDQNSAMVENPVKNSEAVPARQLTPRLEADTAAPDATSAGEGRGTRPADEDEEVGSAALSQGADTIGRNVGRRLRSYERPTRDVLLWENVPNHRGRWRSAQIRINQWGMRDKEYSLARPPGTYRIALLGSSMTVGAGVPVEQTMETLLEDQLNRDGPGTPSRRYEILNFSVGGYGIMQNAVLAEQKVFSFRPDAVLVAVLSVDAGRMTQYLSKVARRGYRFSDPYVQKKMREAGADSTMEEPELLRRLRPISEDLVRRSYAIIVEASRRHGVPVIGIVLPEPRPRNVRSDINQSARLAAAAGLPLLDLRGVYDGLGLDSLKLPGNDPHWSAAGHRLIFERTYELMRKRDAETLKLGFKK
jgi:hypothetical protein